MPHSSTLEPAIILESGALESTALRSTETFDLEVGTMPAAPIQALEMMADLLDTFERIYLKAKARVDFADMDRAATEGIEGFKEVLNQLKDEDPALLPHAQLGLVHFTLNQFEERFAFGTSLPGMIIAPLSEIVRAIPEDTVIKGQSAEISGKGVKLRLMESLQQAADFHKFGSENQNMVWQVKLLSHLLEVQESSSQLQNSVTTKIDLDTALEAAGRFGTAENYLPDSLKERDYNTTLDKTLDEALEGYSQQLNDLLKSTKVLVEGYRVSVALGNHVESRKKWNAAMSGGRLINEAIASLKDCLALKLP